VRAGLQLVAAVSGLKAGFTQSCGYIVPHAKLAVREEFPDQVAATTQNFLLGA
jgi:hypothetical protein